MTTAPGYVYILHFDTPFHHARHYTGSTRALLDRFTTHAYGDGARLMRVLMEEGVEWMLGGLWMTDQTNARKAERWIKGQKNAERYCQLCHHDTSMSPPKCTGIDLTNVPFPTDSRSIRAAQKQRYSPIVRIAGRDERPYVWEQCRQIMQADKECLGFIPVTGEGRGLEDYADRQQLWLAEDAAVGIVGYACYTRRQDLDKQTIGAQVQQVAVRDTHRLCGLGRRLVYAIRAECPNAITLAKVKADLPAVDFWHSIGYQRLTTVVHLTSNKPALLFQAKPLGQQEDLDKTWNTLDTLGDEIPY